MSFAVWLLVGAGCEVAFESCLQWSSMVPDFRLLLTGFLLTRTRRDRLPGRLLGLATGMSSGCLGGLALWWTATGLAAMALLRARRVLFVQHPLVQMLTLLCVVASFHLSAFLSTMAPGAAPAGPPHGLIQAGATVLLAPPFHALCQAGSRRLRGAALPAFPIEETFLDRPGRR